MSVSVNLPSLARMLGGEVTGGHVVAPGPGHSKQDRSLAVFLDSSSPDLFRVHSFCSDDWRTCRDHVRGRLGLSEPNRQPSRPHERARAEPIEGSGIDRTRRAVAIWAEAGSLDGSPAAAYLAKRGVDLAMLPGGIGGALRWHPSCPWESSRQGAMLALMTDPLTGKAAAIHRTAITASGGKLGKKMLGPSAGGVIRLWPNETVHSGLVLGEGIETTLAAATRITHRGTRLAPAWASATAGGMAKFPVLAGIEALTLLVDNDESGTGQRAAAECSARWTAEGREVSRLVPNVVGTDFADFAGAS